MDKLDRRVSNILQTPKSLVDEFRPITTHRPQELEILMKEMDVALKSLNKIKCNEAKSRLATMHQIITIQSEIIMFMSKKIFGE
jgi:hypothetical protein